jgi:hypothetical protein
MQLDDCQCWNRRDATRPVAWTSNLLAALGALMALAVFLFLLKAVMQSDPRGKLQLEAQVLAQRLALAAAEARYTGKSLAWTAGPSGYQFWQLHPDTGWTALHDQDALPPRMLPPGMLISELALGTLPVEGAMRVEFAAYGAIPDFAVELTLDSAQYQVTASTAGEFLAFPVTQEDGSVLALR